MFKYLLIPALCCLIISSCVTTHSWDQLGETKKKQKRMSVCDCIDLLTHIQKEAIASFHDKDSTSSIESIQDEMGDKYESEITFFCSELDKNMTQKQKEKLKKKAEGCKSFKEFKLSSDSIMHLSIKEFSYEEWPDFEEMEEDEYEEALKVNNEIEMEMEKALDSMKTDLDVQIDSISKLEQAQSISLDEMSKLKKENKILHELMNEYLKDIDLLKQSLTSMEETLEDNEYEFNPDLAFKAQEIFSALESGDFDLFLDLVKVDTVDFFYWRIPSADFNRKNLEGMSIEIEGGDGPITVNALEYVEMLKGFDMHLLEQDKGRQKGSGYDGSCTLRSGVAYCANTWNSENDCYELIVFNDHYCLSYLLEEYGSIEELIPDPYLMRDALLSHCSNQSEIWMAFDESNGFKFIGVYDWYWTP